MGNFYVLIFNSPLGETALLLSPAFFRHSPTTPPLLPLNHCPLYITVIVLNKIYNYDRDSRFPRAKTTGKTKEKGRKKTTLGKRRPGSIWYNKQQAQQCTDRSLYTTYWPCCFNESNDSRFS